MEQPKEQDAPRKVGTVISVGTTSVMARLRNMAVGDVVTWLELEAILHAPRSKSGHHIKSARDILQRDVRMVFSAVAGVGLKRLDDVGIITDSKAHIGKARRAVKRGVKKATCVDFEGLDNEHKIEHNTFMSLAGAIGHALTPAKARRIEMVVRNQAHGPLALAETLEHLK